jgi:hypothetical protein
MSETPAWFAARLLFERSFDGGPPAPALYEETVVLLKSTPDIAEAEMKAAKLGKKASHDYKNPDGETVAWTFKEVLEVIRLNDAEINEGSEVYFRFLNAKALKHLRASLAAE